MSIYLYSTAILRHSGMWALDRYPLWEFLHLRPIILGTRAVALETRTNRFFH